MDPLLHELVEHPDDVERYLVFADALQTRGDPRGELIALQCRGTTTADQRFREAQLLAIQEEMLFANLPPQSVQLEWKYGFVTKVQIDATAAALVAERRSLDHPSYALVRTVAFLGGPGAADVAPIALRVVCDAPARQMIESLALGNRNVAPPSEGALAELVAALPRLRALEISALTMPALRPLGALAELAVWSRYTTTNGLDELVAMPWPALQRLVLGWNGAHTSHSPAMYAALEPMFAGTIAPQLAQLALVAGGFETSLLDALAGLAMTPRLRSLGLDWNRVATVAGEAALVRAKPALANLELVWPRPAGKPFTAGDHFVLGRLLRLRLGRAAEARAHYAIACELDPSQAEYWFGLGNALGDLDDLDAGLAAFDRAIKLAPGNASVWYNRGRALVLAGRFDDAIASFERAVEVNPGHTNALDELGDLQRRLGRIPDGIATYRRAAAVDPAHAANKHLVDALLEAERAAEALAHVDALLVAAPGDRQLLRKRGRALLRLGRPTEALVLADPAVTYFDRYLRLAAQRDAGDVAGALATCDDIEREHAAATFARVAAIQRAVISGGRAIVLAGTPPTERNDRAYVLLLDLLAAVLRDTEVDAARAALDALFAEQAPGFAAERRWDLTDTVEQVARVAPLHAALVAASYARITGRSYG